MSLRFPYDLQQVPYPVVSLGGRWVRPRPIVPVLIAGTGVPILLYGRLDSAADDTIFSEHLAARIGVDLTEAPTGVATGVASGPVTVRYAQVTLCLFDQHQRYEWLGWVGFTAARLNRPLLGFAGCLQFFTTTFHGDLEVAELAVNRLYPGT